MNRCPGLPWGKPKPARAVVDEAVPSQCGLALTRTHFAYLMNGTQEAWYSGQWDILKIGLPCEAPD